MVSSTNASDAVHISKMLEDCNNFDKDVRHTGAFDLC
jgi:hypothetical protein